MLTATWLSFIKTSSLRLNLWLVPPPIFTPYFCINLKFGKVFLVQHILHDLPFTFFTNLFVVVATPETNPKKLSATLSLLRIPEALPFNIAITLPLFTFLPSFVLALKKITLKKIFDCLKNETNEIKIGDNIAARARRSVQRMAEIGR